MVLLMQPRFEAQHRQRRPQHVLGKKAIDYSNEPIMDIKLIDTWEFCEGGGKDER